LEKNRHPAYNANKYEKLNRGITPSEYNEIIDYAFSNGLRRGFEDCFNG